MQFTDVIGHEKTKKSLIDQLKTGRVSHAQLFLGKEGGGNFQLAFAFAQYVNCENRTDIDSCGSCHNCKKYQNVQHPDLSFVFPTAIPANSKEKPSSENFFKQWREFLNEHQYFDLDGWCKFIEIEKKLPIINKLDSDYINQALSLKSYESEYKVMIIWWPEKMNLDCANKILKTLEEPSDKSLFIMVAHNLEELLPTIISRVQVTKLEELSDEAIAEGLKRKFSFDDELANSVSKLAQGSYATALSLAKNPDKDEYLIAQFQLWMRLCYKLEVVPLHQWVEDMSKNTREMQKGFLAYCLRMFRECVVKNYGSDNLAKLHHKEEAFVQNFSKFIHAGNIIDFNNEFNDAIIGISRNGNPKIIFMSVSLKVCNFLRYKV